jgi:hypothetical protein
MLDGFGVLAWNPFFLENPRDIMGLPRKYSWRYEKILELLGDFPSHGLGVLSRKG